MTVDLQNTGLMRLERGAMQNWSDLEEFGVHVSPAMREVVGQLITPASRVLILGSTAMDVVTEVADIAGELVVFSRSIPDCAAYASALVNRTNVEVVCGDLLNRENELGTFDLVLALEDLSRVPSLEDKTPSWAEVFGAARVCAGAAGKLVLAVENELGLHRITSLRSPYTDNANASWDVVATYDSSRPRTRRALEETMASTGTTAQVADLLPTWDEHTLVVWNGEHLSEPGSRVLASLTMSSPALRRLGADPTRVTRAAVLADQLLDLASGWLVVTGAGEEPETAVRILASTADGAVQEYQDRDGQIRCGERLVEVPQDAALLGEMMLDACASGDSARFRSLVQRWWVAVERRAVDGRLSAAHADVRFDNILISDDEFISVAANFTDETPREAAWRAIVDLVAVIRARGARHLWPAATDDRTMASVIGAMAGVPAHDDLDALLGSRETQVGLPARDVSGLLAVIERLEEKNKALASRANWFENRLNQRERELRGRAQRQAAELALAGRQQEQLRKSAEDVRKSLTYRLGNVALGPLKEAKKRVIG